MLIFSEHSANRNRRTTFHCKTFAPGLAAVIGLFVAFSAISAIAAETVFTGRGAFEAALGTFRVITFEPDQGFSIGLLPSFDGGRIAPRSDVSAYFGPGKHYQLS